MIANPLLFMRHSQIVYQKEPLLLKNFFDPMISLESEKMTTFYHMRHFEIAYQTKQLL